MKTRTCVGTEKHKGCGQEKKLNARGLCSFCYQKHQRAGWQEPAPSKPRKGANRTLYTVACLGCKEYRPHYGRGLCRSCYRGAYKGPVRECCDCGERKPHQALGRCKECYMRSKASLYASRQREAYALLAPEHRAAAQAHQREYRSVRLYGLTTPQIAARVEEQEGKCQICATVLGEDVNVDHCHNTGKVRGILCHKCNIGLGHFDDDTERMQKAIDYVVRYR